MGWLGDEKSLKLGSNWVHFAPSLNPKTGLERHPYISFPTSLRREDQQHNRGSRILFGRCDCLRVDIQS